MILLDKPRILAFGVGNRLEGESESEDDASGLHFDGLGRFGSKRELVWDGRGEAIEFKGCCSEQILLSSLMEMLVFIPNSFSCLLLIIRQLSDPAITHLISSSVRELARD